MYCVRHLTLGLLNNIICQGSTGAMGEAGRIGNPGIDVSENASYYFMSNYNVLQQK